MPITFSLFNSKVFIKRISKIETTQRYAHLDEEYKLEQVLKMQGGWVIIRLRMVSSSAYQRTPRADLHNYNLSKQPLQPIDHLPKDPRLVERKLFGFHSQPPLVYL